MLVAIVEYMYADVTGMCSRYLNLLFDGILNGQGQQSFVGVLSTFRNPPDWPALQNPVSHRKSYGFTELGRLVLLCPFLLEAGISPQHIHNKAYEVLADTAKLRQHRLPTLQDQANLTGLNELIYAFVALADHILLALQDSFTLQDYDKLEKSAVAIRVTFQSLARSYEKGSFEDNNLDTSIAESLGRLPNIHVGVHLVESARRYGTLNNVNLTLGEERHKTTKRDILHISQAQEPMKQLMVKHSVKQALDLVARNAFVEQLPFVTRFPHDVERDCPRLYSNAVHCPNQDELRVVTTDGVNIRDVDRLDSACLHSPMSHADARRKSLPVDIGSNAVLKKTLSDIVTQQLCLPIFDIGNARITHGLQASFLISTHSRHRFHVGRGYVVQGEQQIDLWRY